MPDAGLPVLPAPPGPPYVPKEATVSPYIASRYRVLPGSEPYVPTEVINMRLGRVYNPERLAVIHSRQSQLILLDLFLQHRSLIIAAICDGATHLKVHQWFTREFYPVLPHFYIHFTWILTTFQGMIDFCHATGKTEAIATQLHAVVESERLEKPEQTAQLLASLPDLQEAAGRSHAPPTARQDTQQSSISAQMTVWSFPPPTAVLALERDGAQHRSALCC